MKPIFAAPLTLLATPALAHDAGGLPHLHPHGGEALFALVALTVAIAIWRWRMR